MARHTKRRNRPPRATLPRLPAAVWQTASRLLQRGGRCLLCSGAGVALGLFVPDDPPAWGFRAGYNAARVYLLCQACFALPDKAALAENVLWQERQRVVAGRWN